MRYLNAFNSFSLTDFWEDFSAIESSLDFSLAPIHSSVINSKGSSFQPIDIDAPIANATIDGTNGDDVLTGTNGDDVITTFAGNDIVDALGGDDVINISNIGSGSIFGGDGFDIARVTELAGAFLSWSTSNDVPTFNFNTSSGRYDFIDVERFEILDAAGNVQSLVLAGTTSNDILDASGNGRNRPG